MDVQAPLIETDSFVITRENIPEKCKYIKKLASSIKPKDINKKFMQLSEVNKRIVKLNSSHLKSKLKLI